MYEYECRLVNTPSRVGMDYTLSIDTPLCIFAYSHLVSAPSPCHSLKNGVGAWFRIVSVFIVVSLPTDFPSSRPTLSQWGLEDECVLSMHETFPEFGSIAPSYGTSTGVTPHCMAHREPCRELPDQTGLLLRRT